MLISSQYHATHALGRFMWSGGMQEGEIDTPDTRIYRHITTWHQHEVAPPPAGPGRAVAWWSTVESLSWCLEAPFAGTSTLHAISDQNAPMQSSSGTAGGAEGGARRPPARGGQVPESRTPRGPCAVAVGSYQPNMAYRRYLCAYIRAEGSTAATSRSCLPPAPPATSREDTCRRR